MDLSKLLPLVALFPLSMLSAVTSLTVNTDSDSNMITGGTFDTSTNAGDLRGVLNFINQDQSGTGDYSITFLAPNYTIYFTQPLPVINQYQPNTVTITGPVAINGSDSTRGLFANLGTVSLDNMRIQNTKAKGGVSNLGGGGLGAGAGLFINQANVTISNIVFRDNSVVSGISGDGSDHDGGGGMGGNGGGGLFGGGGGGLFGNGGSDFGGGGGIGNGGDGSSIDGTGGGGGGGMIGCDGGTGDNTAGSTIAGGTFLPYPVIEGGGGSGSSTTPIGGAGAGINGGDGGGNSVQGANALVGGGGGGGYAGGSFPGGGNGGSGGGGGGGDHGGNGGFGGGGGSVLGDGGFGGGGGGGDGNGGFGGGGGDGNGGFGAGAGDGSAIRGIGAGGSTLGIKGGDGAALGAAIFVNAGNIGNTTGSGGSLTIGNGVTILDSSASPNSGLGFGGPAGSGIFFTSTSTPLTFSTLTFSSTTSGSINIHDPIGDDSINTIPAGQTWQEASNTGLKINISGSTRVSFFGTNTYSGDTHIGSGSSLFVTNSNALGSSPSATVTVEDGAELDLFGGITVPSSRVLVLAGHGIDGITSAVVGGSGINTWSGPVSLSADSSISCTTGDTLILSGLLTGTDGQTLTSARISSGGTCSIAQVYVPSGNFTIDGSIGGTQPLTKTGTGNLTFLNTTVESPINLNEGSITLRQAATANFATQPGTRLDGVGTMNGASVGGVLSPGFSPGTISSTDTVNFLSTSTFEVQFDHTASSLLNITGPSSQALIDSGSQILISQLPGSYPKQGEYTILHADGGISGTFIPTLTPLPGFQLSLLYQSNDLILSWLAPQLTIPTTGLSGNARKTANYLNENGSDSTLALFDGLSGHTLKQALNSASPSRNAFSNFVAGQMAFSMSNLVSSHLDVVRLSRQPTSSDQSIAAITADTSDRVATPLRSQGCYNKFSGWVGSFVDYAHLSASHQNPGFHYLSEALMTGLDYNPTNKDVVGGSLGYVHTQFNDEHHAGHGHINSYYASVYGNAFVGDLYFSPAVWGVYNQIDQKRNIYFSGFKKQSHADISSWQFVPHLEIGYEINQNWGAITPFTSADLAIVWQKGYKEQGSSPFNMHQRHNDSSMIRSETGLKLAEKWCYSWGAFFLKEKVSYVYEKPFGTGTVNGAFVGTPGNFTVTAVNQDLNLGSVGIDFLFAVGKCPTKINFGYEGEFGGNFWSNELNLTISKDF